MTITAYGRGAKRITIKMVEFPNGERMPQLSHSSLNGGYTFKHSIVNSHDLVYVCMIADALRRAGATEIVLEAPYIFGARQDRVCNEGEPLGAYVVATLLNTAKFKKVITMVPHSDVIPALINNCTVVDNINEFLICFMNQNGSLGDTVIISPDAGAEKRTSKLVSSMTEDYPDISFRHVKAGKERSVVTGELTGFTCEQFEFNESTQVIVLDDICANGGTFIGLAAQLKRMGVEKPSLFVAHADHVHALNQLTQYYKNVGTTSSTRLDKTQANKQVTILPIQ